MRGSCHHRLNPFPRHIRSVGAFFGPISSIEISIELREADFSGDGAVARDTGTITDERLAKEQEK